MCICVAELFVLGYRLSQLKVISLQLISKHLSFHQKPHKKPEHLLQQTFLFLLLPLLAFTTYLCVWERVFMCVPIISRLTLHLDLQAVKEKVTLYPQQSVFPIHSLSILLSLSCSLAFSLSLNFIGYHCHPIALVFHRYLCLLSLFFTHHPLFHLCHAVFDLLCVSCSIPSVSIFNLSLSPTSHPWLCKMNGEE